MRSVVLDTHILVWWNLDRARLTRDQRELLTQVEIDGQFVVSAMSLWEIAKLVEAKRLTIPQPLDLWLAAIESHPLIRVEPLTTKIITTSVRLQGFHRDPADEIIVATAYCLGLVLVTSDERIRRWPGVVTV